MGIYVPTLTAELTRQQEHLLEAAFGLSPLQVQENGGRAVAELARTLVDDDPVDRSIVVLAGRGNNGAVGMVAARHLLNWGGRCAGSLLVQCPGLCGDSGAATPEPTIHGSTIGVGRRGVGVAAV